VDLTKEQRQILCTSRKSASEALAVTRQAFEEESMISARKVHMVQ
jgi:hypothetical protein